MSNSVSAKTHITTNPVQQPTLNYSHFISVPNLSFHFMPMKTHKYEHLYCRHLFSSPNCLFEFSPVTFAASFSLHDCWAEVHIFCHLTYHCDICSSVQLLA